MRASIDGVQQALAERSYLADRGLATTVIGGEVLDGRGGADEHRGLTEPGEQAEHDERGDGVGERVAQGAEPDDERAAADEDATAPDITQPSGPGAGQRCGDGEGADDNADGQAVAVELVLDVAGQRRYQRAHRQEVEERGGGDDDEARRHHPLRLDQVVGHVRRQCRFLHVHSGLLEGHGGGGHLSTIRVDW